VIQNSASECVLVSMLAARAQAVRMLNDKDSDKKMNTAPLLGKIMAYCSKQAHSCVEKAANIAFVGLRMLETDENHRLRGETLRAVNKIKSFEKSLIVRPIVVV